MRQTRQMLSLNKANNVPQLQERFVFKSLTTAHCSLYIHNTIIEPHPNLGIYFFFYFLLTFTEH